jgi:hypothetical protein
LSAMSPTWAVGSIRVVSFLEMVRATIARNDEVRVSFGLGRFDGKKIRDFPAR